MDYQRVLLSGSVIDGDPDLPAALVGLSDESLADLAAALDPCPTEYAGVGYWPIQPAAPTPDGKVATARHVEMIGGQPTWVETLEDAPPVPIPPLTRRQLRLGLLSIGITAEDVEAQINAIADPTERAYGMIEWQDATQFRRDHPLIAQVAVALALPSEQVDDLWVWALGL